MDADAWIHHLQLVPHPEGGHYRETWRAEAAAGERAAGSAIFFLLRAGERSHWHRVDQAELWFFHGGAPLELRTWSERGGEDVVVLGTGADQRLQGIVAPLEWQSARSLGEFSVVSCVVSPAFSFEHFELAPPDWSPPGAGDTP